jgi:hypothetical protein
MLRGALIGAGKIAQTGHVPAFLDPAIAARAALVAAVEPATHNRDALQRLLPEVRCYESLDDLLSAEPLDYWLTRHRTGVCESLLHLTAGRTWLGWLQRRLLRREQTLLAADAHRRPARHAGDLRRARQSRARCAGS